MKKKKQKGLLGILGKASKEPALIPTFEKFSSVNHKMEKRLCGNPRCYRAFDVTVGSTQSICSIECYEITYGRPFARASFAAPIMRVDRAEQKRHQELARKRKELYKR